MFERPTIKITYVHVPKVCNLSTLASARVIMADIRVIRARIRLSDVLFIKHAVRTSARDIILW